LHLADERQLIYMVKPRTSVLQVSWHSPSVGNSVVVYLRDVTHETEVDRMKSEFLSSAAHELRTPMASIMGFSELLMMREFSLEKTRDMLGTIHRQAKRLTVLINELLDLARIEARAGKDFNIAKHPLAPVILEAVNSLNTDGDRGRIQLVLPDDLPELMLDPAKYQQAVINLLSNAYKYSPEGGDIEVFVVQQCLDGIDALGLVVRDHGIGMSTEQSERVFERFYRADPSGNIPGTGLGMSLVKEVMEGMGGCVSLASEPGVGTTVTLWLKLVASSAQKILPPEASKCRPYGELTLWGKASNA
jgi:signal transduction histidine kinase